MIKKTKPAVSYDHITPQTVSRVKAVLADADKHKYSVSRVYGTHNEVFQRRDVPQSCSSCLRNRARELRTWLAEYEKATGAEPTATTANYDQVLSDYMEARQITEHSTAEDKRAALLDFMQEHGAQLPEVMATGIAELMATLVSEDADGSVYDRLVKRLGLAITEGDHAGELATLNTVIGSDYSTHLATIGQPELTDEETDAVLTRMGELEELVKPEAQYDDPAAPGFVAPAMGVVRHPMGEGVLPFDFTPSAEDANKGTVTNADGSKVKAGTYTTAAGLEIAVQPGGKASIKVEDLT